MSGSLALDLVLDLVGGLPLDLVGGGGPVPESFFIITQIGNPTITEDTGNFMVTES